MGQQITNDTDAAQTALSRLQDGFGGARRLLTQTRSRLAGEAYDTDEAAMSERAAGLRSSGA